jgi:ABC-type nitrate/sulfonate/bicarbonate transport system substrate-binding protein
MKKNLLFLLICVSWLLVSVAVSTAPRQETTIVLARSTANWPIYIAKEGGYYARQGLDVRLAFAVNPVPVAMLLSGEAQMASTTLEQAMQVASKDGTLVVTGSFSRKTPFALMAATNIQTVQQLKGKRVGISAMGDGPYNYTLKILEKAGLTARDVEWIPVGANNREAALVGQRVDASLINAPAYFRLEEVGYRSLANIVDQDDIYGAVVHLFTKESLKRNSQLPDLLIRSHAQAVKRFYEDKPFALRAFRAYDSQKEADVARIYDYIVAKNGFERVPYVPRAAVTYVRANQFDPQLSRQLRSFDFRRVIDNVAIDRLVEREFFTDLFGRRVETEQEKAKAAAFR